MGGDQTEDEFEGGSDVDSTTDFNLDELSRRVDETFKIFDQHGNNTVELNDLAPLVRCLRINAKQRLIKEISSHLAMEDRTIPLDQLKPRLMSCMQEETLKPPTEKTLQAAFRTVEEGYEALTKDRLEKCLTTQGEHLSAAEWAEMLNHLPMKKGGEIDWKAYIRDVLYILNKKF
ncbi:EF-hand calcium-binding domain-containing protein 2 isoform X3 [Aphelenchoides fujianensis]|nr:EF-hand calcium-binding domain-containing protein 2 isoform X3 [Aphelenchoides fujianensis]